MSDFTYTVFLIVTVLITSLLTMFTAGVIGLLFYDNRWIGRADPTEPPSAA